MPTKETVAELTVFYKRQRLKSLIFDNQKTADKFVETMTISLIRKAIMNLPLAKKQKRLYPPTITGELHSFVEGDISPNS